MHVIIGAGASIEIRTVQALGSIYLDTSIHHSHSKGTLIRGFKSIEDMNEVILLLLLLLILLLL